jgi:hypothetical protein
VSVARLPWPHFGRTRTLNAAIYCALASSISAGQRRNGQVADRRDTVYGSEGHARCAPGSDAALDGGMMIATLGTRLTTPAILSAMRPCSSLPVCGEKLRPGKITLTCAPGDSASWRTRSSAHLVSPRSGQSTNSSGTPRSGCQAGSADSKVTGSHVGSHWRERLPAAGEQIRTDRWRSCQPADRPGQR